VKTYLDWVLGPGQGLVSKLGFVPLIEGLEMSAQQRAEATQADWREFVIEALIRVLGFHHWLCPDHLPLPASRRRADLLQGATSNLFRDPLVSDF